MKFLIRKLVSNRTYTLKSSIEEPGNTLYWMSREQRTDFNHALNEAFHHSVERRTKLYVVFSLTFDFLSAETRHYDFMLAGLVLVSRKLQNLNIHFEILEGIIPETIAKFIEQNDITTVFCDFDPLKIKRNWKYELSDLINCSLYEIDSHNIVPCRLASTKQEFSARTIVRKSINCYRNILQNFHSLEATHLILKLVMKMLTRDFTKSMIGQYLIKDLYQVKMKQSD